MENLHTSIPKAQPSRLHSWAQLRTKDLHSPTNYWRPPGKTVTSSGQIYRRKAFDSINQESMFAILRHYVILLRSLVQSDSCVTVPNTAVLVDGRISESFEVTTGVLKGGVLAPFLFIVVLICTMWQATIKGHNSGVLTHPRGQPSGKVRKWHWLCPRDMPSRIFHRKSSGATVPHRGTSGQHGSPYQLQQNRVHVP